MTLRLLVIVIVGEAVLVSLLLAAHVAYAVQGRRRRSLAQRRDEARTALIDAVVADRVDREVVDRLLALRPSDTDAVVCEVAIGVHSKDDPVFGELAEAVGLVGRVEADVRSRRWWVRRAAVRRALALGLPTPTIASLLEDRDPRVRATAAHWTAALGSGPDRAARIVALFDDADAGVRHAAMAALTALGSDAQEAIVTELADPRPGRLVPTITVATALRDPVAATAVEPYVDHDDVDVRAAAIRAVGLILDDDDASRLVSWLADADPAVRAAATDAAASAGLPSTAGAVARNLAADEGPTREAAIEALGRLGPAGDLLLRRAARQVGASDG